MTTYTKPGIRAIAANVWAGIKRLPATAAALTCTGVGITYNAEFAAQFGQAAIALAVASDVLKGMAGPIFMSAWRSREWGRAGAAFLVGLVTLTVSLVSAFGSAQHRREATADDRGGLIRAFQDAEKAKKAIDDELALLGPSRPVAVIQAEVSAFKIDAWLWSRSKQCQDATKPDTQTYCAPLNALYRERGAAARRTELEPRIRELEAVLAKGKPAHADPLAAAMSDASGFSEDTVRRMVSILIVLAIEIGSIGGSIMATAPMARRRREANDNAASDAELARLRQRFFATEAEQPSGRSPADDEPPKPASPQPRRRRTKPDARRAEVKSFCAAFERKNGRAPEPREVRQATGLPRSTAWRYQNELTA